MTYKTILTIGILLVVQVTMVVGQQAQPTIDVFKSATCGCCNKWVEHLQMSKRKVIPTRKKGLYAEAQVTPAHEPFAETAAASTALERRGKQMCPESTRVAGVFYTQKFTRRRG